MKLTDFLDSWICGAVQSMFLGITCLFQLGSSASTYMTTDQVWFPPIEPSLIKHMTRGERWAVQEERGGQSVDVPRGACRDRGCYLCELIQ